MYTIIFLKWVLEQKNSTNLYITILTLRRECIFSAAFFTSLYRLLRRSVRSSKLSRESCFSSFLSNNGTLLQVVMIFWISSMLFFDFCTRVSRSCTLSRVSSMYSQTPFKQTANSLYHENIILIHLAHNALIRTSISIWIGFLNYYFILNLYQF